MYLILWRPLCCYTTLISYVYTALLRIDEEIRAEKEKILLQERQRIEAEIAEGKIQEESLQEERKRLEVEEKARHDALKLLEIQQRQQQEEAALRQKLVRKATNMNLEIDYCRQATFYCDHHSPWLVVW